MTIIFPSPIFGPVHSCRLGVSFGINLLPSDGKVCSFDCIYCECGYNSEYRPESSLLTREEARMALEDKLKEMKSNGPAPDILTFAGNGEPTAHPCSPEIIGNTFTLCDIYFPGAKVSALSNATSVNRPAIFDALNRVDNDILKLDTVGEEYIRTVDRPNGRYDLNGIVGLLKAFKGNYIVKTMFMKGKYKGKDVDSTSDKYVLPWLEVVKDIVPRQVMIYTIDRETPDQDPQKATPKGLDRIVTLLTKEGFSTSASY